MIYRNKAAIAVGMATVMGSRRVCFQFLGKTHQTSRNCISCIWKHLRQKGQDKVLISHTNDGGAIDPFSLLGCFPGF